MAFDLKNLMNDYTKAEGGESGAIAFKIVLIDIKKLEPSKFNKYSVDDIAELKTSIELVGLQQNLVVRPSTDGQKYEILSGHRRYKALQELVTEGKEFFARVPCKIIKSIDDIQAELQLIFANSTSRRLTGHEMTWQASRLKEVLRTYRDGGYKMTGKTREIVAGLLKVSPSQVHRLESIDKNLISELKEEFQKENINTTTAFELSRLSEEKQREALADLQGGGELTPENVQKRQGKPPKPARSAESVTKSQPPSVRDGFMDSMERYANLPPSEQKEKLPQKTAADPLEILPCPFCGSRASIRTNLEWEKGECQEDIIRYESDEQLVVACDNRDCQVFKAKLHETDREAILDWNKRV